MILIPRRCWLGMALLAALGPGPTWASAQGAARPSPAHDLAQTPASACAAAQAYSRDHAGLSFLVVQGGVTLCDDEHAPGQAYELYSGTKSFVGLAAAAAVQDGLLTLDEPVSDTLSDWRQAPEKRDVTIRQLIGMVSGLPSQMGRPPTYAEAVAAPFNTAPGAKFQYGPAPMQAFGELLRRKLAAKGLDADSLVYIERRLLAPLGVHYSQWRRGSDGQPLMPQGASFTPQEWAKIGQFVLAGGRAGGKALVDPDAFKALFVGTRANPSYGLTWWLAQGPPSPDFVTRSIDIGTSGRLPKDLVVAAGAGGQRLYVIPSLNLVVVRQARFDAAAALAGVRQTSERPDDSTRASDASRGAGRFSDTELLTLLLSQLEGPRP